MEHVDLAEVARRPQRYWTVDGLPELVMGLLWMVWGAAWLIGESLPRDWRYSIYWTLTPVLLVLSGFAAVRVIKRLKARLTFPRTGYVEWRSPSHAERLVAAGVAMVTAMVLAATVMKGGSSADHAAPVLGVILSLSFVVASLRQRAPHYLALAAVALATGVSLGTISGGWASVNWMFLILGAAAVVLGAVRFTLFVRRHPLAEAGS
jgi:hypothetical protein